MLEILKGLAGLAGVGLATAIGLVGIAVLIRGYLPWPESFGLFRFIVGVIAAVEILALAGIGLFYLVREMP